MSRLRALRFPTAHRGYRGAAITGVSVAAVMAAGLASLPASGQSASGLPASGQPASGFTASGLTSRAAHVLLLSVDGMHQSDLSWYVTHHPSSALAHVVAAGTSYTHAWTPFPSDSFPGMVGLVTGGNPRTTGVYYDVTYNPTLLAPGTTSCAGATPGTVAAFDESIDRNTASLDAGQGLAGLPGSIALMTGSPQNLINTAALPVDPTTCQPVLPHQYIKVNTVFEVLRQRGAVTAWSDKHAAYEILNGPSGNGISDLFTPEINSDTIGFPNASDWTKENSATQAYDTFKVTGVLNEIDGYDHSRSTRPGVPAIFGMNFQTVSTAEKLPTSDGQAGGYLADGVTPGPVLSPALDFIDAKLGAFLAELTAQGLASTTTIILTAKHGQSPTQPAALTRINDATLLAGLDAAWESAHPGSGPLVAGASDDDGMLVWLTDRSSAAAAFTKSYLLAQSGTGTAISGALKRFTSSGLSAVYAGAGAAAFFGVAVGDSRVPDLIGIAQYGTVYTGGTSKIAEHGGFLPQDRRVPLVVSGAGAQAGAVVSDQVGTVQVAPTILALLGVNPQLLQAVRSEHTAVLPMIR